MTALNYTIPIQLYCSSQKSSSCPKFHGHSRASLPFSFRLKPFLKELQQNPILESVGKTIKDASKKLVDAYVDFTFEFVDQPLLPSQSNFAPVEEIGSCGGHRWGNPG